MKSTLLPLLVLSLFLSVCSCKKKDNVDATTASLSKDFARQPDSTKIRMLLETGMPMDSLGIYMAKIAAGEVPGIEVKSFADVEAYLYSAKGESAYELYYLAFDEYSKSLPLVKKLALMRKSSLADPEKIGYQLGLEYVNDVIDKKLTLGKIDNEIASLRQACSNDEDTYKRFLKGFAIGLKTRAPGQIPSDILAQYASAK